MKILLVEDEEKMAAFLKMGLEEQGYVVRTSSDGNEGLKLALEENFDLVILDVMLPGRDGWSILSELRAAKKQTLTVFLTARDGIQDRVHGLDLGADAYLVKPFAFAELSALIRSLLRRESQKFEVGAAEVAVEVAKVAAQQNILHIDDLTIDRLNHTATRAGTNLDLTPKEFALLLLLAVHRGEILNRSTISEKIWNISFDSGTNTVEVHIRRLRLKVDGPWEHKIIKTVRGSGYTI